MKRIALLIALSIASPFAAAETLYVQSLKAELKTEPNFTAKTTATAIKGEALNVIGKTPTNTWYKVSHQGKEAWVFRYVVSAKPPLGKVSGLAEEAKELDKGARRRASTVTTTAAVRGLSAEDRARSSRQGQINFDALEKMDNMVVTDNDAVAFLNQRK